MGNLLALLKIAWPFIGELFKSKPELGRYVLGRKVFLYLMVGMMLVFGGMVYMSNQAVKLRMLNADDAKEIAALKQQLEAVHQDNESLKLAVQACVIDDRASLVAALRRRTNVHVTTSTLSNTANK